MYVLNILFDTGTHKSQISSQGSDGFIFCLFFFQMLYFQCLKCVSSTVKTRHYSCSHVEHQARSIIFLENHYACVLPLGGSTGRENRSSGMMISSDLITSGAKPDNGKWFLVLSVSLCQIHDGTKIALMNSWHSKIQNFSFWMWSVESGCHFCICEQDGLQMLGYMQYFSLHSLWGSNQMLLIFILIIINRHHTHIWF